MSLLLDRAYCINLDGQRDRWWEIEPKLEEWNRNERLPEVQRFPGVDEEAPPDWERGAALWGCFEAHRRLLGSMRGITRGVLILEDDADIKPGFAGEVVDILREFKRARRQDWSLIYLGGKPLKVSLENVGKAQRAFGVMRRHAYIIREPILSALYEDMSTARNIPGDSLMATFTESRENYKCYYVDLVKQLGNARDQ